LNTTRGTVDEMMTSVISASNPWCRVSVFHQTKYWSAVRWYSVEVRRLNRNFSASQS